MSPGLGACNHGHAIKSLSACGLRSCARGHPGAPPFLSLLPSSCCLLIPETLGLAVAMNLPFCFFFSRRLSPSGPSVHPPTPTPDVFLWRHPYPSSVSTHTHTHTRTYTHGRTRTHRPIPFPSVRPVRSQPTQQREHRQSTAAPHSPRALCPCGNSALDNPRHRVS